MNGSAFVLTINYIAEKNYRQCFFEAFFSVKIKKIMFNTMPNAVAMGADRPILVRLASGWILI